MFMVSFRLRAGRVLLCLALIVAVTLGVIGVRAVRGAEAINTGSAQIEEVAKAGKVNVKTAALRLEFIRSFGWEIEDEPAEVMEVIIPKEFDAVYEAYNSIQKKQGYDLTGHAGKRCKRYSYVVTNYPGESGEVRFNLLVRDNKVIGGDVSSMLSDGFMHGFAIEQAAPEKKQ